MTPTQETQIRHYVERIKARMAERLKRKPVSSERGSGTTDGERNRAVAANCGACDMGPK